MMMSEGEAPKLISFVIERLFVCFLGREGADSWDVMGGSWRGVMG